MKSGFYFNAVILGLVPQYSDFKGIFQYFNLC
jgi:hypothetical protein